MSADVPLDWLSVNGGATVRRSRRQSFVVVAAAVAEFSCSRRPRDLILPAAAVPGKHVTKFSRKLERATVAELNHNMALLRSFCCCNVRTGSMFTAIYSLLASSVYIGLIMIRYVGYRFVERSLVYALVTYSTFAVFGLLAATAAFLIYAVYNDHPRLFVPWLVMVIVAIMYGTGTSCWSIIAQSRHHQEPHPWEITLLVVHSINTAINIYCLLCVFSQYQDLSHGKGTSQYYRRQRRTIHQTGIAGLVEEIVSGGCGDNSPGGVPNIGLSLEDLHENGTTPSASMPAPPSYCEAPPAYSTLPRQFEQQIERMSFRSTRDQEIFIMGTANLDASALAGVHSSHPPRYTQGAPPSYIEAVRLSRLPPVYCPHARAGDLPSRSQQQRSSQRSNERSSERSFERSRGQTSSHDPYYTRHSQSQRSTLQNPNTSSNTQASNANNSNSGVSQGAPVSSGAVPYPEPVSSQSQPDRTSSTSRVAFIYTDMGSVHI